MKNSIRGRILALFLVCLALGVALTGYHYWNLVSLRERFDLVEDFYRLFNNVLEVRRYEKNYIIFRDTKDLKEAVHYLDRTQELTTQLTADMKRVGGEREFAVFTNSMQAYSQVVANTLRDPTAAEDPFDLVKIRQEGKEMVDYTQHLLRLKRQRIHEALNRTMAIPMAFLGSFVVLLVVLGLLVSRNILRPLALIQRTTIEVARGNFQPIAYQARHQDEVSSLVEAFNRMALEIETRQEELVQSRKIAAIGTFTSGIAHELNNPINNIRLTAETLLDDVDNLTPAETSELSLDILSQADRAGEIVKNLLDFSRMDRPGFSTFTIGEVLDSTYKLVKNQIMVDGITLDSQVPPDLPPIQGSLRNLQQVFLNLLLNAVQAMPSGGSIRVTAVQEPPGFLRIDVSDSGGGIKPEDLEHIFDPFYTTKEVGQGTGLGLSVSYGLVKKHGGYIEVQSHTGQGSTFTVYLPVAGRGEDRPQ
ncbi:MAG: HAMP domain-containing histidine kinase [Deltaproteobacteria bacterium]|nr:HAMP domain-containing histidine kinase [Deltaproteobacteria bacterium]